MVNAIFVYLSTSSQPGVVTEQAYEKGLAYNETIANSEAQARLGWSHDFNTRLDMGNSFRVALRLKDKYGEPLARAGAGVRFIRPAAEGMDFDIVLKETRPGTYLSLVEFPELGLWDVYIAVGKGDDVYRAYERVVLP